jgi:hypothetical protein
MHHAGLLIDAEDADTHERVVHRFGGPPELLVVAHPMRGAAGSLGLGTV